MALMREILEVLERHNHPVGIVTKSALVMRDIDILSRMAEKGLAKVALSVTTLDRRLARTMEPRASTPSKRLEAIRHAVRCRHSGLGDGGAGHSRPQRSRDRDASSMPCTAWARARPVTCCCACRWRWRRSSRNGCCAIIPERYRHVLSLIRSMRGGKDYDAEWGKRMRGTGPYAWQIARRFELATKRLGLNSKRLQAAHRPVRNAETGE